MADNNLFTLRIITPDRVFFEGQVSMVEFNTTEGEIGIYKKHVPTTVIISPGILTITGEEGVKEAALHAGFVEILQDELKAAEILPYNYDFEAHKELVGMQPGDVEITYADVSELERDFGFKPSTSLRDGLRKFAQWYKAFY